MTIMCKSNGGETSKKLLKHDSIKLNQENTQYVSGQTVLITGAGGSIGSELARKIIKFKPLKLILLDRAENSLFEIINEIKSMAPNIDCELALCDIQNRSGLVRVFEKTLPNIIFHAAAYKHVSLMENYPTEAVFNNIVGSRNLLDVAVGFQVLMFVNISTDKSVNPSSVMGASKRVVESLVYYAGRRVSKGRYVSVRFGNVIGSSGSVIPLFKKQIAQGGPVTVTDPKMTRYFMTISDAVNLVLQVASFGKPGKIYLLDMGKPVKILDLAKQLVKDAGLLLNKDIKIEFIGIRPGEKLDEQLYDEQYESKKNTAHEKIFELSIVPIPELEKQILILEDRADKGEVDDVRFILRECVRHISNNNS